MALGMSSGQGVPFYDPFYRVNIYGMNSVRSPGSEESLSRYYDDFSVFSSVHISKPQSLSLETSTRAMSHIAQSQARQKPEERLSGKEMVSTDPVSIEGHEFDSQSVPSMGKEMVKNT